MEKPTFMQVSATFEAHFAQTSAYKIFLLIEFCLSMLTFREWKQRQYETIHEFYLLWKNKVRNMDLQTTIEISNSR